MAPAEPPLPFEGPAEGAWRDVPAGEASNPDVDALIESKLAEAAIAATQGANWPEWTRYAPVAVAALAR